MTALKKKNQQNKIKKKSHKTTPNPTTQYVKPIIYEFQQLVRGQERGLVRKINYLPFQ